MERLNRMIQGEAFREHLVRTQAEEKERIYCKHGMDHLLGVARIAYAYLLEREEVSSKPQFKELVYAAALLHDLGRWVEYKTGEDHAQASVRLAKPLLIEAGFQVDEVETILDAIMEHRQETGHTSVLARALALADDWARDCGNCSAQGTCHKFSPEMLNITY
ncbi:MAG: HD domain-containing protein [Desulfitobacteriaceae bacterium]|nr:HD domain-containing protein [Desulfitobacteriaceae bacterium]MDI6878069.1 HD domain-containing protein [Desulfitobacteriaceae bacterium]MDI6913939.1 HD domain-containing protein [Desulfitobacteriaceae bacterium]